MFTKKIARNADPLKKKVPCFVIRVLTVAFCASVFIFKSKSKVGKCIYQQRSILYFDIIINNSQHRRSLATVCPRYNVLSLSLSCHSFHLLRSLAPLHFCYSCHQRPWHVYYWCEYLATVNHWLSTWQFLWTPAQHYVLILHLSRKSIIHVILL